MGNFPIKHVRAAMLDVAVCRFFDSAEKLIFWPGPRVGAPAVFLKARRIFLKRLACWARRCSPREPGGGTGAAAVASGLDLALANLKIN